jgi:hypothetical protein
MLQGIALLITTASTAIMTAMQAFEVGEIIKRL